MAHRVPWLVTGVLVAVTAGLLLGGTVAASGTSAQAVTDCRTISEAGTYDLAGNITASEQEACLRIESSNVTLAGHGHTISGEGNATGTGVLVTSATQDTPLDDVTVRNLTVTNWETGVLYRDVTSSTLSTVTSQANGNGLVLTDVDRLTVHAVAGIENDNGLVAEDVSNSNFDTVTVRDNDGDGLYTSNDFDDNRLENVTARDNGDEGVRVGPAWNTSFLNTTADANAGDGVAMLDSRHIEMEQLSASHNDGVGLRLTAVTSAQLANVTALNNSEGIYAAADSGNVTVGDLTAGPGGTLSISAGSATLKTVQELPPTPAGMTVVGPAVNVSGSSYQAERPKLTITLANQTGAQPTLWQYQNGRWNELADVQYDAAEPSLTGTVGNGILVPMAPAEAP